MDTTLRTASLAGRTVTRVGYGAMQLAGVRGRPSPPRAQAIDVLRDVVAAGVTHVDTAQFYGTGAVNELIREALHPYPEQLALVSKVGAEESGGTLVTAQRPEQLRASVEANLHSLGVERLAVVNLRRTDTPPGLVATGDQVVDLDNQLAELVALRDAGTIGGIGLSSVTAEQLVRALPAGITCVQNAYSLLDRSAEPLLQVCADHDIAWVPYFPLGSGFPGTRKVTEDPTVIATAARLDLTPSQVGLAWLLGHDPHVLLIPGTSDPAHLAQNVAADRVRLDERATAELDALATTG